MSEKGEIEVLLTELREAGRFAPRPRQWADWFKELTRGIDRAEWPSLPLILSGHWATTAAQKSERLAEHLRWAEGREILDHAVQSLLALDPDAWRPLAIEEWTKSCGDL